MVTIPLFAHKKMCIYSKLWKERVELQVAGAFVAPSLKVFKGLDVVEWKMSLPMAGAGTE